MKSFQMRNIVHQLIPDTLQACVSWLVNNTLINSQYRHKIPLDTRDNLRQTDVGQKKEKDWRKSDENRNKIRRNGRGNRELGETKKEGETEWGKQIGSTSNVQYLQLQNRFNKSLKIIGSPKAISKQKKQPTLNLKT